MDADIFLVVPSDGEIYHLDALGAALWRLLETPMSAAEAAATLALAFPDAPPDAIQADSERFFADLSQRGLIEADPAA
ncbi:MAG: PqqD family protein [Alphaproteobacteria bacterium]